MGGGGQVRQTHLAPNSDLFSDLGYFVLKIFENLKILSTENFFFKTLDFWGCPPPRNSNRGTRPSSPGGDAQVHLYIQHKILVYGYYFITPAGLHKFQPVYPALSSYERRTLETCKRNTNWRYAKSRTVWGALDI